MRGIGTKVKTGAGRASECGPGRGWLRGSAQTCVCVPARVSLRIGLLRASLGMPARVSAHSAVSCMLCVSIFHA
eukprot:6183764-Pleurochrysis_carterae.AAC.4